MKNQTCKNCGGTFNAPTLKTVLCSEDCRQEWKSKRCAMPENRDRANVRLRSWRRAKRWGDPVWRERDLMMQKECHCKHRDKRIDKMRERYRKLSADPAWMAKKNEKERQNRRIKLAIDPAVRERQAMQQREWRRAKTADPVWLARRNESRRNSNLKKAAIFAAVKELGLIKTGDLKC